MGDLKRSSKGDFSSSKNADVSGGDSMASATPTVASSCRNEGASCINCTGDINNLVDEEYTNNVDGGGPIGTTRKNINAKLLCQKALLIVAYAGIIMGTSVGVRLLVTSGDLYTHSNSDGALSEQQRLLVIAERVVLACSEHKLNEDLSDCMKLCDANMCCFEEGEHSCEDDEYRYCAVYAGCEALIDSDTALVEQQRLLEIAERVLLACSEYKINEDLSECKKLCEANMCCFEEGMYSCEDDENRYCAVYAACEALLPIGKRG
eukprot:CAMPEP_0201878412 /NCGR_PEP_ID=MMETSP0902-20130614/9577_1 /ASSEMBLY_ACC=CAM_ASM_000551 /TAXON_ID=420261 /ORGANISM="Thalassiosira antarctica, Strain CCMP982" /LENGTH=263 /DNA_ID=CAMNT_0048406051 /DNA_START=146 /DNA_END=937 /DNA_ORIENTATION=-